MLSQRRPTSLPFAWRHTNAYRRFASVESQALAALRPSESDVLPPALREYHDLLGCSISVYTVRVLITLAATSLTCAVPAAADEGDYVQMLHDR